MNNDCVRKSDRLVVIFFIFRIIKNNIKNVKREKLFLMHSSSDDSESHRVKNDFEEEQQPKI